MSDLKVPGANEWGKKRVDFYVNSRSRVREDGILNEEEQEMLELEEEDAVERQRKLDSINSVLDYKKLGAFVDDSSDEYEDESWDDSVEQQKPTKIGRITLTKRKDPPPIREFSSDEDDESKKTTRIQLGKRQGPSQNQRKGKVKFVEGWEEEAKSVEKEERRKINYEIEKNKGFKPKRKKEARHSRVKRRAQYKKALIKRRSQVPDVKRELNKYGGEMRGIRMSTVRSVPLK